MSEHTIVWQNGKANKMRTYKDAGVDIDAGNEAVRRIRPHVESTYTGVPGEIVGGFGGFSGGMKIPTGHHFINFTVHGVGTKVLLAIVLDRSETIGIDLVAMCANDLLVGGYRPWVFLDYLAQGRQVIDCTEQIIKGIAVGCREAGMVLRGGEMAEMPGLYAPSDYDLAGFAAGIARSRKDLLTDKRVNQIKPWMHVYALPSSGVHSNGFSLIRRVFGLVGVDRDVARNILATPYSILDNKSLGDVLLEPTRIYVHEVGILREDHKIAGLVHITGGGLVDNPPRILPDGCAIQLDFRCWAVPPIFRLIQKKGKISLEEMVRVFNMGLGMLVISENVIEREGVMRVGKVVESTNKVTQFIGGQDLLP